MIYVVLVLICASINSLDDTNEGYRRQFGMSFHKNCGNYYKTFKCMTACKSMGFQVFRLDYQCRCTCHELKTTSILPAFVWRTNGTTKKPPVTFSPNLYDIVGTLSPQPRVTTQGHTNKTVITCPPINDTITTNVSDVTALGNGTETTLFYNVSESSRSSTQAEAATTITSKT